MTQKFKIIFDRLNRETNIAFEYLKVEKMSYNDIRFTKINTHYNFIKKLGKYDSNKNYEIFFSKFQDNHERLNCFLN